MPLLVGDNTVYTVANPNGGGSDPGTGYQTAFQYTAAVSGIVTSLHFQVGPPGDTDPTCESITLSIYSDSGDAPDALLGTVDVPGSPSGGDTVAGSGLGVPIEADTKYWLAYFGVQSDGPSIVHSNIKGDAGGSLEVTTLDPVSTANDPFPALNPTHTFDDGPATFWAEGIATSALTALTWQVTGLWPTDADSDDDLAFYGTIADPVDGEVRIPRNDSRTAQVTVSVFDPIVQHLVGHAYARMLKVYYHGDLVFWGPCKLNDIPSMAAGVATISAVDPSLRLINHFVRRGDINGDLGADTQDRATVSIDATGLRLLRDAGLNTSGQTIRGVPDLGIVDGSNDFVAAPDDLMGVARGDEAWEAMLQLSQSLGPDFELEPVEGVPGVYVLINTFATQGTDKSATVVFHFGTGHDNLEDLGFSEGSKYVTHVQVLDRESTYRVTPANLATSAETGPYVEWVVTEFDARNVPRDEAEAVLLAYGQDILDAYSHPLIIVTLTLPVEQDADFRYLRDFEPGDIVGVAGRAGYVELPEGDYRISTVTLKQEGPENATRTELEVVASHTTETGTEE